MDNEKRDDILWVDVETTGLNTNTDALLQVAAIITDPAGNELSGPLNVIVRHDNADELRADADPFVRSMHDATGLWGILSGGAPTELVDTMLYDFMLDAGYGKPRMLRLGGSSCRLDLNFLEANLPVSYAHLHYRSLDVSGLAWALAQWGVVDGYFPKAKTHNALDDIRESIAEFRWLREAAMSK